MKHFYLLLATLLLVCGQTNAQRSDLISGNFSGKKFSEFVEQVEKNSSFRFFYNSQWTDSVKVSIDVNQEPVEKLLQQIFKNTDLQFAIDDSHNIFITKERKIMTVLPADFFPNQTNPKKEPQIDFDFSDYEKEERKIKIIESKLFVIGDKNASPDGNAIIAGNVRDAKNGEPVVGATVFLEKSRIGASTNEFGYYSLAIPKGRHELRIQSVGMKTSVRQIMLYSNGKLDIELTQEITPLKEVVVESKHEAKLTSLQMGTERLDIQTMRQIPLALGETDIMKVVLALPGVQSVGEGTVGLNVRGGATNQNLILLNDAVVYNPSHLFGFFSTFNPDVLKNVELYKSGIKAEYGGRLSSVLDVHTRDGNTKKISGSGGISPITGRLSIEGPLVKEKTSFIIGGRSTYSNWILRQIDDDAISRSKASFYDVTAGVTSKINESNDIYLSTYFSKDKFNFSTDTVYAYSDKNASLKWKHIFNNKLLAVANVTTSNYMYSMSSSKNPVNAFQLDFDIRQTTAKIDLTFFHSTQHTIDAGISATRYKVAPGKIAPHSNESLIEADVLEKEQGLETAIYFSDNIEVNTKLSAYIGLRYSTYYYFGPKHVFQYREDAALNTNNIIDTIAYPGGKSIANYGGPEPRLALRYSINENLSVKASYNRMRQYIQMLSNTTAINPTDIWKLSDSHIRPQIGDQFSIGFYKNFTKKHLIETSIEAYWKTTPQTIDYKNGAVLLLNHALETDIIHARGKSFGIEFLIKKSAGKINGWASYTYSRSLLKTSGKFVEETVNDGRYYPSNFDKPHAVNFISNYKFSRRFNFSLNLVYSTGRPITIPIAKYQTEDGGTKVFYSERNAHRIPDYFRSDISINLEGNHKVKKLAHYSWTFAIYNLTGRKNAYSVYFKSENGVVKGYKLSIFAQAIPTLTYNFKF
jgi:hypothetical protein